MNAEQRARALRTIALQHSHRLYQTAQRYLHGAPQPPLTELQQQQPGSENQAVSKVIICSSILFIHIDDPIQIGEVPVEVYSLGIAAPNKPVLEVSRLHGVENGQVFIENQKFI
ncbi:UNVERIFIED_CONTAM: hypothetical protein FKN15_046377 [Acipenser sinensis]